MRNPRPKTMNVLYLIALIMMGICLLMFFAAVITLVLLDNKTICVLIAAAGTALSLIAIILAMFSKPKVPKEYDPIIEMRTIEMPPPVPEQPQTKPD